MEVCLILIESIVNIGDKITSLETGVRETYFCIINFSLAPFKKASLILSGVLPEAAEFPG